ncbi:LysR family transcriptional regulator [Psychromonas marina]|uniref:LysR family transcriptional regulator n=1 Tax=Psychromonas marina TaxID=88364 RepID=A0ABQ6E0H3_9GAMM|nr:LysR family transcriptional regulator [Psychromonas marina]GLS90812.1 LysR family transcriptional regulator [Psychromonas marina]
MTSFDMNLIRPFVKVYELNSITKTADLLNVSQPAISGSIKRLEQYLGYALFIRSGRNLNPTPNAHSFFSQISPVLDIVDNAVGNKENFIVYAPESILIKLNTVKNIQLIEAHNSEQDIYHDLRMRQVDLVIGNLSEKDNSFCYEPVHQEKLKLVCRQDHPSIGNSITLEQYHQAGHVALKCVRNDMRIIEYLSETALLSRDIKIQVSSPINMLIMVQNTDHVTVIPESLFPLAESLGLKVLSLPFDIKPLKFDMIYHKRYLNDKEHIALRALIKEKVTHT